MEERRLYRDTLQEAALAVGGVEQLALRLGVDVDVINRWLAGAEKPPLGVFLEALEAIAEGPWRVVAA